MSKKKHHRLVKRRVCVAWTDEASEQLEKLDEDVALSILGHIAQSVRQITSGKTSGKVRHMCRTRSKDPRLHIECGHYRAIALLEGDALKGDILTITEIHYRDEQTYKKVWQWQTAAHTHGPQQAS